MVAVLNSGFERGAVVERVEKVGDNFVVNEFPTYGPKALSGLEDLADTLADRTFSIQLVRAPDRMPRLKVRELEATFARLRRELWTWTLKHATDMETAYANLPDELQDLVGLDDRYQDIAEPLVVIASLADADQPAVAGESQKPSILQTLLTGLREAAGHREPSDREAAFLAFLDVAGHELATTDSVFIASKDLRDKCLFVEDLERVSSEKALAHFLKPFGLSPRRASDGKVRGYHLTRDWLNEWSRRYRRPRGESS